jgi:DNA-binding Lrp family transcriptional regulator
MALKTIDEIEKLAKNFYKYLDFTTAKLIEHILSYDYLPLKADITKDLGIPSYTLSRKFNYLKKLGVAFGVNIDFSSIGLRRLVIIVKSYIERDIVEKDEKFGKFLNFYAPILLPFQGTLLTYYIPASIDVGKLISALSRKDIDNYEVVIKSVYSKAKLTYHFDFIRKEFKIDWDRLYRISSESTSVIKGITDELCVEGCKSSRFDLLDLLIIDQLEVDPFRNIVSISKELGISYAKVLRHLKQHVSRIVRGFRLRLIPLPLGSSLYVCIRVEGNYNLLYRLANALSELVFIAGIHLSPQNAMYILAVITPDILNSLIKFLSEFGVDYDIYLLDRTRRVVYTLPYTGYSKFLRDWTI